MNFLFIPSFLDGNFDGVKNLSFILVIFYGAVLAGVLLDLISGIERAKREGVPRRSGGLKRTVYKIKDYFNLLLLLTVVDIVASIWFRLPYFTAAGVLGLLYTEGRSIYENKKGLSKGIRDLPSALYEILENKDKLRELLKILNEDKNRIDDEKN